MMRLLAAMMAAAAASDADNNMPGADSAAPALAGHGGTPFDIAAGDGTDADQLLHTMLLALGMGGQRPAAWSLRPPTPSPDHCNERRMS